MWKELKFNIDAKAHVLMYERCGIKGRRPQDEIESMTMTSDTKGRLRLTTDSEDLSFVQHNE